MLQQKQIVTLHVQNLDPEADFFRRIYDSQVVARRDDMREIDTGRFILRLLHTRDGSQPTQGVVFAVEVPNVNRFAEEVWNRGIKYASRPQNYPDGTRRVAFKSPSDLTVEGVGPPKIDSTGAFPAFR